MQRSTFTGEPLASALRLAELATAVEEVRRKLGISGASLYDWRKRYGDLELPE